MVCSVWKRAAWISFTKEPATVVATLSLQGLNLWVQGRCFLAVIERDFATIDSSPAADGQLCGGPSSDSVVRRDRLKVVLGILSFELIIR